MSTPVNLNKYRKQKAREEAKSRADSNAVAFGQSKSEKSAIRAAAAQARQALDAHKQDE